MSRLFPRPVLRACAPVLLASLLTVIAVGGCQRSEPTLPASGAGGATVPPAQAPQATPTTQADAGPAAPAAAPTAAADTSDHAAVNASIDRLLGDHADYERAIEALRQAVLAKDAAAVAALVKFPLKATIDGAPASVADAADFTRRYDAIMTPAIVEAVTSQAYAKLFVNQEGVMFGDGQVWINGVCKDANCKQYDVRVITIQPAS